MKHHLAIIVKFHGATNSQGSRVSLRAPRFKKRRVFNWNHALGSSDEQAREVLKREGVEVDAILDMGDHYILTVADWMAGRKFFKVV